AGLAIAIPYAWSAAGGLASLVPPHVPDDYWSFWRGGASGLVYLPLLAPSFIVSPGILQKVYGARDGRAVRTGVLVNGLVLLAFAGVPPLLGMLSRALHPELAHHELALATLLRA